MRRSEVIAEHGVIGVGRRRDTRETAHGRADQGVSQCRLEAEIGSVYHREWRRRLRIGAPKPAKAAKPALQAAE